MMDIMVCLMLLGYYLVAVHAEEDQSRKDRAWRNVMGVLAFVTGVQIFSLFGVGIGILVLGAYLLSQTFSHLSDDIRRADAKKKADEAHQAKSAKKKKKAARKAAKAASASPRPKPHFRPPPGGSKGPTVTVLGVASPGPQAPPSGSSDPEEEVIDAEFEVV
jgi:hypothetical protein